jgi:hypothetical protein
MCDREERDAMKVHFPQAGFFSECEVRDHVAGFVGTEAYGGACQERSNLFPR